MKTNHRLAQIKKRRKELEAEYDALVLETQMIYSTLLKEKIAAEEKIFNTINKQFANSIFCSPDILEILFSPIKDLYYISRTQAANKRLSELNVRFVWQLIEETELYWQQPSKLGRKLTKQISQSLSQYGLFFGMNIKDLLSKPKRCANLS